MVPCVEAVVEPLVVSLVQVKSETLRENAGEGTDREELFFCQTSRLY
jgi:hypothetical protein